MPLFEFKCEDKTACKHRWEELCSYEASLTERVCPKCSGKARKLISRTAFKLVGDGWYKTGYGTEYNSRNFTDPENFQGHDAKTEANSTEEELSGSEGGSDE